MSRLVEYISRTEPKTNSERAWFDMAELFDSGYVLLDSDLREIYSDHGVQVDKDQKLLVLDDNRGFLGLSGLSLVSETHKGVRAWFVYDHINVKGFKEYLEGVVEDFLADQGGEGDGIE